MKRTSYTTLITLTTLAMLATGCKKENLNEGNNSKVTLGVRIAPSNSKIYIDGVTPKWEKGDQVNVNGNVYTVSNISGSGSSASVTDVTTADIYCAVYPDGLVSENYTPSTTTSVTIDMDETQTYAVDGSGNQKVEAPMGALSTNGSTSLTFHNLCSLLKVRFNNNTGEVQTLKSIKVSAASANLSGSGTATIAGNENDAISLTTGQKYVTLDLGTGVAVNNGSSKDFYVVLPQFTTQTVTIEFVNTTDETANVMVNNVALGHNMIASKTCNVTEFEAATATFTVGMDGSIPKKVIFSTGNLVYNPNGNGSTQWYFHPTQYGRCLTTNGTYNGTDPVDLFTWGATGLNGIAPNNTNDEYYTGAINLSGDNDWGTAYNNANGATGWRTLKSSEWQYLFNNHSYGDHTVHGVKGIIVLPDGVTSAQGFHQLQSGGLGTYSFDWTTVSDEDWTAMEAAGAVFLPVSGRRNRSTIDQIDGNSYYGNYWSSTYFFFDQAYYMNFGGFNFNSQYNGYMYYAYSVRLVRDR